MSTSVLLEMPSTSVPLSIAAGYVGLLTMARCISSVTLSASRSMEQHVITSVHAQHMVKHALVVALAVLMPVLLVCRRATMVCHEHDADSVTVMLHVDQCPP